MAKKKQSSHLNWHPDFRIESELPDIKIIRTDFIINGIAGFIALSMLVMVLSREFSLRSQHAILGDLETEVADLERGNTKNLNDSTTFKAVAPLLTDLEKFYLSPIDPVEIVVEIANILPEGVFLERIDLSEVVRKVKKKSFPAFRLQLSGKAPTLEAITEFKESVEILEVVSMYPGNVVEFPSPRDEATGFFSFRLDISINPEFK